MIDKSQYANLENAYSQVTSKKQFDFGENLALGVEGYQFDGGASHEAGYDAMMTGVLFYKLVRWGMEGRKFTKEFFTDSTHPVNVMYSNRISMARRTPINLNLEGTASDGLFNQPTE